MGLLEDSYISFVNLDHRKDRLQHMQSQLYMAGIKAERTRGILPGEWNGQEKPFVKMLTRPQKGAIGCFLSQLNIMKKAKSMNKHAFVMEDDIVFCSDFQKRIEYLNEWMDSFTHFPDETYIEYKEWDILWLGATFHVNPPWWHKQTLGRDAELTDDPHIIRTYGSFCTYSYIVNVDSIQKVLNLLETQFETTIGIDHAMIQISPQLRTFAFVPGCCKQIDNASDQFPGAYTEFSRFEKLNGTIENSAYWWQDKMEDFDPLKFNWAEANIKK